MDHTPAFQRNLSDGINHATITGTKIFVAILLLLTFLFGFIGNSLYLWVLKLRMKKNINTVWFFNFILGNLFFVLTIPFLSVYVIWQPHWILGTFLCKVINSLLTLSMYVSVFLLTIISLDRYMLVFHPHWYRRCMTPHHASVICILVWIFSFVFSSPYLVLRQVKVIYNQTICYNDFTFSGILDNEQRVQVNWGMYYFRTILGFLIPFLVITTCYIKITCKIRKEHLVRSSKPYKIIFAAITSFFISWLPYHVWYGMKIVDGRYQEKILNVLYMLTVSLTCFNCCFTPILYLFVVENFKALFKMSILSLMESAFNEAFISTDRSIEEKSELPSSLVLKDENPGKKT